MLSQWTIKGIVKLTQGTLATSILHKYTQGRLQVANGKKELRAKLQKADNESTALQVDPGGPASHRTTDYVCKVSYESTWTANGTVRFKQISEVDTNA